MTGHFVNCQKLHIPSKQSVLIIRMSINNKFKPLPFTLDPTNPKFRFTLKFLMIIQRQQITQPQTICNQWEKFLSSLLKLSFYLLTAQNFFSDKSFKALTISRITNNRQKVKDLLLLYFQVRNTGTFRSYQYCLL